MAELTKRTSGDGAEQRDPGLFAVILAAGLASRFGSAKQLAEFEGTPLATRAVRLGESICGSRTVLVAGHEWLKVVDACSPLQGFFVCNGDYRAGLGGSIACGVRSVAAGADAVLLLLADQPLITRSHLERLAAARTSPDSVVATGFAGTLGPPVLFPRRYFSELCRLQGDSGARQVLAQAGSAEIVQFEEAAVDIDRPDDLR